jgi:transposase
MIFFLAQPERMPTSLGGTLSVAILGIDISKNDFHVQLIAQDSEVKKNFLNTEAGFRQLDAWLKNRKIENVHACMEATGSYWEALAVHLHQAQHVVSVVNPVRTKAFAQSEMLRAKTDAVDAAMIARFCKVQKPAIWTPPPAEYRLLQQLSRQEHALKATRAEYITRLQTPLLANRVIASLNEVMTALDLEIKALQVDIEDHIRQHPKLKSEHDLLLSIPGIGSTTATTILAEIPNISEFQSAKQISAYAGLSPRTKQSGTSVRGNGAISRTGNARLRKAFFFPAQSARRHNVILKTFAQRLEAAGKRPMVVICAIMRKLLVLSWAILRSGKPFDPIMLGEA